MKDGIVTEEEMEQLILSLGAARYPDSFSEEEAEKVVNWAVETRINQGALEGVLNGTILVNFTNNEMTFQISPKGKNAVEAMIVPGLN